MENQFKLVLGESQVLEGKMWSQYLVTLNDEAMICRSTKTQEETLINFKDFEKAQFGIGNGNLWLQCVVSGKKFTFCAPRKEWKSIVGKELIERINVVTKVEGMKEYNHYTGPLFFIYMFK